VTRWITPYLATASFEARAGTDDARVVDLRDLVDKGGNAPELVRAKLDAALGALRAGEKVVLCCDYGLSRSNALAAGVIAVHESVGFGAAVRRVLAATESSSIRVEVLAAVRIALGLEGRPSGPEGGRVGPVLVTGGSGLLGRIVLPELADRFETVSPPRSEIDLERDAVLLDLLVRERGIRTILHLANPRVYTTAAALGAALVMLKNVLTVCLENHVFLIFLSGWEVFSGYQASELAADEGLPARPGNSGYGQAKFLCEKLIECHRDHGLEYLILRSSPVYGPGSDRPKFIWNFLGKAARHEEIPTHHYLNGHPRLDLLYQDDLRQALVSAVARRPTGILHLGTGVATSTSEVAAFFVRRLDSSSRIRHHEVAAHTANIVMDTRRAAAVLGFRPVVDVATGLEAVLRSRIPLNPAARTATGDEGGE
jgi:nucleoside-diphosphate-sugar epimerase